MAIEHNDLEEAARIAPAGIYVALHVGFSFPQQEINRLPLSWIDFYTINTLGLQDPVLRWLYTDSGIIRWPEIADAQDIIAAASQHGLCHGAAASIMGNLGRRSYAYFFRNDRQFNDNELSRLFAILTRLHRADYKDPPLTPAEIEALRMQSEGKRLKQIAWDLGISVSAVKARLANAKRKLGAQTASQAVVIATSRRIF